MPRVIGKVKKKRMPRASTPARKKTKKRKITAKGKVHKKQVAQTRRAAAAPIEFCSKCGSIMLPVKKTKHIYLTCRRCGSEKKKSLKFMKIKERPNEKKGVAVLEKDTTPLPITIQECNQCGNKNAYFWLQQTRSADEPPTQFFRCTKCKHTWREYK